LLNQFDIWEYAPYAFDVEDHDYQLGVNLSEYEPYAFDDDDYGYLLGIVLLERTTGSRNRYQKVCSEAKFLQLLSMDIDREILRLAMIDEYRSSCVEDEQEQDDEPCSKNAVKMLLAAEALVSHLSAIGEEFPQTRAQLSELGGIHRQWGHWYRPLLSEPFDQEGAGSIVLICCGFHSYRINVKLNSSKKWEMVLNRNVTEALRQHEVHEQSLQVAS
jgi:hypothetical protein